MRKTIIAVLMIVVMIFSATVCAFAAEEDPNITIVNPALDTPVYSTSLLVSVKITKPETIKVTVLKEGVQNQTATQTGVESTKKVTTWSPVFTSEPFVTTKNLTFYTKKLENVKTGNYIVRVDTLDADGKVIYQTSRKVTVKEKAATEEVFAEKETGTVNTFLQSLLKSIFGK